MTGQVCAVAENKLINFKLSRPHKRGSTTEARRWEYGEVPHYAADTSQPPLLAKRCRSIIHLIRIFFETGGAVPSAPSYLRLGAESTDAKGDKE